MPSPDRSPRVAFHFNDYQPPRQGYHHTVAGISTDPNGVDWSEAIAWQSYKNRAGTGIYKYTSYNTLGTLIPYEFDRIAEKVTDDSRYDAARRQMVKDTRAEIRDNMAENGVGESGIHLLLPRAPRLIRRAMIREGYERFKRESGGKSPTRFWGAETAFDIPTLEDLTEVYGDGVGFICAPYQVERDDRGPTANQPVRIDLPNGRIAVGLPYDKAVSHTLSYDAERRKDAVRFAQDIIQPALDGSPNGLVLLATDGELLGHHDKFGHLFAEHLLKVELPQRAQVTTINQEDLSSARPGRLNENLAWSCEHGGLGRWSGECPCCSETGMNQGWKKPYQEAHQGFLKDVLATFLEKNPMPDYEFIHRFSTHFWDYLRNTGRNTTPEVSLWSALASAVAGDTSCAVFFPEPGVSGNINFMFVQQGLSHMRDAGLIEAARKIEGEYMEKIKGVFDPRPGFGYRNGEIMINDLMSGRQDYKVPYDIAAD